MLNRQRSRRSSSSERRPSLLLLLALCVLCFALLRVAAGAPLTSLTTPVAGLLIALTIDRLVR